VVYTYSVNNETYTSSKITIGDPPFYSNISTAKQTIAEYPPGKIVQVHYDPELPALSALIPGRQNSDYILAGITGLFMVIGILFVNDSFRKNMNKEM
jgi:hypothetical protein